MRSPRTPRDGRPSTRRQDAPLSPGGESPDDVCERHTEGVREDQEVVEVGCPMPVLPAADALHVAVDAFAELLLGEPSFSTRCAELHTDNPAAGNYPVGRLVAVHATKLE